MEALQNAELVLRDSYTAGTDVSKLEEHLKVEYTKSHEDYICINSMRVSEYIQEYGLFEDIDEKTVASIRGSLSSAWGVALKRCKDAADIDTFTLAFDWMKRKYSGYTPKPILVRDIELVLYKYKKDYVNRVEKYQKHYPDGHKGAAIHCVNLWLDNDISGLETCCDILDENYLEMLVSGMEYMARDSKEYKINEDTLQVSLENVKAAAVTEIKRGLEWSDFRLIELTSGNFAALEKAVRKYKKAVKLVE